MSLAKPAAAAMVQRSGRRSTCLQRGAVGGRTFPVNFAHCMRLNVLDFLGFRVFRGLGCRV